MRERFVRGRRSHKDRVDECSKSIERQIWNYRYRFRLRRLDHRGEIGRGRH